MTRFKVGDTVTWNGAGPGSRPRWYTGQIVKVNAATYNIVDNEWFATSEVAQSRVRHPKQVNG